MNPIVREIAVAAGLVAVLVAAFEIGFRAAARDTDSRDSKAAGQIGAIQGAVLGLLGLLLAFSFSGAASRFIDKQGLIIKEANAIGTASLRADLLDEPHRTALIDALAEYTRRRIEVSSRLRAGVDETAIEAFADDHARIWSAAIAGVEAKPSVMIGVLPPVNEVIDLHALRTAAGRMHLPGLVISLLLASSIIAVTVIGYGCGASGRRRLLLTASLVLLIAGALWTTIDLDHPRSGLLRLSDGPLQSLRFPASGATP